MELETWDMFRLLDPDLVSKIKIACVYGYSGNEAIIVTKDDEVFSFGSNKMGVLGFGDENPILLPKKIVQLCRKGIKGFAFGGESLAVALTENGDVYSWGKNDFGQLGINSTSMKLLTPTKVSGELLEKKVVEIACGRYHTLALTAEGEVYFWGEDYNSYGQNHIVILGSPENSFNFQSNGTAFAGTSSFFCTASPGNNARLGATQNAPATYQKSPKKVDFGTEMKATAIACGNTTSMALLENGELYGWGYGDKGQLGLGDGTFEPNPCWISNFKRVVVTKVACGLAHTLAISDVGELFAWGDNSRGQLGIAEVKAVPKPTRITSNMGRVVDIAAVPFGNISAAMTDSYEVYMWGAYRGHSVTTPTKTPFQSLNDVFASSQHATITPRPIRVDDNAGPTVAESFRKVFDDPISSDLKIVVNEQPIHVHKAVLMIRCEHFQTMFHERWHKVSAVEYKTDEYPFEVYRSFLQYLYTDEVKLADMNDALELLDLATSYCEGQLKKKCVEIIKRGLTVENVAHVYISILKYDIKDLEESCLKFCVNRMSAVTETEAFQNLDLKTYREFIEKAAVYGVFKA